MRPTNRERVQRAIDRVTLLGPGDGQDKLVDAMREATLDRREKMRRRWRRRVQRLIHDITQFGRDDANSGSWDPRDMDVFRGMKSATRRLFEKRIEKLAKEFTP